MSKGKRFPLAQAQAIGEELRGLLEPVCSKLMVAGSVRRQRSEVGDIEIVAVPRFEQRGQGFMLDSGNPNPKAQVELLGEMVQRLMAQGVLAKRKAANGRYIGYGPLNKFLVHVPSNIPVDLFSTTIENWGLSLVIRTGPKEWNIEMMAKFKALGLKGHVNEAVEDQNGNPIPCRTEEEVFSLLQWIYRPPEQRGYGECSSTGPLAKMLDNAVPGGKMKAEDLDSIEHRMARAVSRRSNSKEESLLRLCFDDEYMNVLRREAELAEQGLSNEERAELAHDDALAEQAYQDMLSEIAQEAGNGEPGIVQATGGIL